MSASIATGVPFSVSNPRTLMTSPSRQIRETRPRT